MNNKRKILIIDESKLPIEQFRKTLENANYEIYYAYNGAEGLDAYVKIKPDLVILDVFTPVIGGFETLLRIKKIDQNAKVVMTSALEHDELINYCLKKGATSYMIKPFRSEDLVITVLSILSGETYPKIAVLLRRALREIEYTVNTLFNYNTRVVLENFEIQSVDEVPPIRYDMEKIIAVRSVQATHLEIQSPVDSHSFVSESQGKFPVKVVGHINNEFSKFLNYSVFSNTLDTKELFSLLNSKILSVIASHTGATANFSSSRPFDNDVDKHVDNKSIITINVKFDIEGKIIRLSFNIVCDIAELLWERF